MTYVEGALIVLACCVTAAVVGLTAFHYINIEVRRHHHEVGGMLFLQLGVIYGVVLAFVFAQVFGEVTVASGAINAECGDLNSVAMLATALPPGSGRVLQQEIARYIEAVVSSEWQIMAETHKPSPVAQERFGNMLLIASRSEIGSSQDATARDQILKLLLDAHQRRQTRLYESGDGVPELIWYLLIGSALVLGVFVAFAGTEYLVSHVLFSVTFAFLVSAILVVIALMNYPFSGSMGLRSAEFAATLTEVNGVLHAQSE